MLNKYPLWKTLMVVFAVLLGFFYAAPNLYEPDHALQVSATRGAELQVATLDKVNRQLAKHQIDTKSAKLENNQILVRFKDLASQQKAREVVASALGNDFSVALNMAQTTPGWLQAIGAAPLNLGLDLRGGIHFLMEVDMKTALMKSEEQMVLDYKSDLREEKIRYRSIRRTPQGVVLKFANQDVLDQAVNFLERRYQGVIFSELPGDKFEVSARMSEQLLRETQLAAVDQNITIIRSRVDALGVAEPEVQRQGTDRIVVQLPGVQDSAKAREILGATATLELHMVNQEADPAGIIPANSRLYTDNSGRPVVLYKRVMLTGEHISDASAGFDENQRPQVSIKLDAKGGNKMSAGTKSNIGKPMATVFIEYKPTGELDKNGKATLRKHEEVINVATIQSRLGRNFRITGLDTQNEARSLAELLKAGALRAPIQIVEERTVGPSLGKENIELGATAIVYGLGMVLLFMLIYYRGFGVVANLALAANVVLILGVMSMIPGATLTLPGMAGIVLTVGMAVDANVLIFERIREELREGRSPQQAIHHGYEAAYSTIFDANITTLIAALILFSFGAGPIKGFAVTLSIGILTSVFTAVVVTRAMVNFWVGGKRIDKLSI